MNKKKENKSLFVLSLTPNERGGTLFLKCLFIVFFSSFFLTFFLTKKEET